MRFDYHVLTAIIIIIIILCVNTVLAFNAAGEGPYGAIILFTLPTTIARGEILVSVGLVHNVTTFFLRKTKSTKKQMSRQFTRFTKLVQKNLSIESFPFLRLQECSSLQQLTPKKTHFSRFGKSKNNTTRLFHSTCCLRPGSQNEQANSFRPYRCHLLHVASCYLS